MDLDEEAEEVALIRLECMDITDDILKLIDGKLIEVARTSVAFALLTLFHFQKLTLEEIQNFMGLLLEQYPLKN